MARVLVDTNVLLRNPEVLAKAGAGVTFLIPREVLQELDRAGVGKPGRQDLLRLVQQAVDRGGAQLLDEGKEEGPRHARAPAADLAIAMHLARAKSSGEDIVLATEDRDLHRVANRLGVPVFDSAALTAQLASSPVSDPVLLARAKSYIRRQWRSVLTNLSVGVLGSLAANLAVSKRNVIVASINIWGTLLLLAGLAISLYWVRGRYRLAYGSAEFFVGFSAAVRVFWPRFAYRELSAADVSQVVAGVYIMVRGFDNIGRALTGTRWESAWRRFSGE